MNSQEWGGKEGSNVSQTTSPRFGLDEDLPVFAASARSCSDLVMAIFVGDLFDQGFERDGRFRGDDHQLAGLDREVDRGVLLQMKLFRQWSRNPEFPHFWMVVLMSTS